MTTVIRWQNIPTVFIRHFALSLSQLKARRHSYQPVVITCPDAAPIDRIPRNQRRQRHNFPEDSRDLRPRV